MAGLKSTAVCGVSKICFFYKINLLVFTTGASPLSAGVNYNHENQSQKCENQSGVQYVTALQNNLQLSQMKSKSGKTATRRNGGIRNLSVRHRQKN